MRYAWRIAAVLSVVTAGALGGLVHAQQGCPACAPCLPQVPRTHCPHPYCYTQEGAPCIHYNCGCPAPVCNPCDLPHYGYFQPCWRPSPFAMDWSHCPEMPAAAAVVPGPLPPTTTLPGEAEPVPFPGKKSPETLPFPAPEKSGPGGKF